MTADTETIREKEQATMKAMTAELADYAEEGGMSSIDADQLRAQILGTLEAALAALGRVEERERALTEALRRIELVTEAWNNEQSVRGPDEDWSRFECDADFVTFARVVARAALAASVAAGSGEQRE